MSKRSFRHLLRSGLIFALFATLLSTAFGRTTVAPVRADSDGQGWPMFGQDYSNTAGSNAVSSIGTRSVRKLQPAWTLHHRR